MYAICWNNVRKCYVSLSKDWIQYEELSSEDVLPSDLGEADGFNSSLYATQSALSDQLAGIPNVVICPQASGDENEDVSYDILALFCSHVM